MPLAGTCNPTGYPAWSRVANVGDYGGAPDKRASEAEGDAPYAFGVYRDLQAQRGSAYSKETDTLVHCEHIALARMLGFVWFRLPEKARANATPARSDERLEYWALVLGIPIQPTDQRWQVRQRCAAHYAATKGPTPDYVRESVAALLGDAFVDIVTVTGTDLDNPPPVTFWPGVADGPPEYDLGQGAWLSERCHLYVQVQQPSGMGDAEFDNLTNVQLFQLLDRLLPIWATFDFGTSDLDGFILDVSLLDFDGF